MKATEWAIAHATDDRATTVSTVKIGDRVTFPHAPDEEWEVLSRVGTIESDYGDGSCPVLRCKQLTGDTKRYSADRRRDGTIDHCGDAIAAAIYRARIEPQEG